MDNEIKKNLKLESENSEFRNKIKFLDQYVDKLKETMRIGKRNTNINKEKHFGSFFAENNNNENPHQKITNTTKNNFQSNPCIIENLINNRPLIRSFQFLFSIDNY